MYLYIGSVASGRKPVNHLPKDAMVVQLSVLLHKIHVRSVFRTLSEIKPFRIKCDVFQNMFKVMNKEYIKTEK